jgi:hypothetical protein
MRDDAMSDRYSFEILPRPLDLGGGWKLRLLEDGQEVGGGVFPVPAGDPLQGIDWWNGCSEKERVRWLQAAGSAVPADAWQAWREAEAYIDAEGEAYAWLDSRGTN